MKASKIYKCLADPQRLRILNLLEAGVLCVCHLQDLLGVPQVKMSKQLARMKELGLIESHREGTWMLYSMVEPMDELVRTNLHYLREADCAECKQLQHDLLQRGQLILKITEKGSDCPESVCQRIGCC